MQSDLEIQNNIKEQFSWNPFLNADDINVTVKDGIVKLSGRVDIFAKKLSAERAAKRVADVKDITDEIEIKPESQVELHAA